MKSEYYRWPKAIIPYRIDRSMMVDKFIHSAMKVNFVVSECYWQRVCSRRVLLSTNVIDLLSARRNYSQFIAIL